MSWLMDTASSSIPRASVFATGGYLVGAATSYDQIFGIIAQETERMGVVSTVDLCGASGLSYALWGPLLHGHTLVVAEGHRDISAERLFSTMEAFWPLSLLTSPRMLSAWRRELGDAELGHKLRFSLVVSCGDMLTPRLARFGANTLAVSPERMVNMWLQSETGAALLSTYPDPQMEKPGAVGVLAYGVHGKVISDFGEDCRPNERGQLVFCSSWPSMVRTLWGQEERFEEIYFQRVQGCFSTNDGMRIDRDGVFWFMRRLDDVVKVQGHSVPTSEVEAVLLSHDDVDEVAVVGVAGEGGDSLVAFVVAEKLADDAKARERLEKSLAEHLSARVGAFFVPSRFYVSSALPRTRSGKVVRRLLNRIAAGDASSGEDLSHLANPQTVKELIER